jgi:hypothetical protein
MRHEKAVTTEESLRPVNLLSQKRHRQQVLLQIWLPLIMIIILLSLLLFLAVDGGGVSVSGAAQVATILMVLILGGAGIVVFFASVLLIVALNLAMQWIPSRSFKVLGLVRRLNRLMIRGADGVTSPIIAIDSWGKAVKMVYQRRGGP